MDLIEYRYKTSLCFVAYALACDNQHLNHTLKRMLHLFSITMGLQIHCYGKIHHLPIYIQWFVHPRQAYGFDFPCEFFHQHV
jgi:hypothetical protein